MKDDFLEHVQNIRIIPYTQSRKLASRAEQVNRYYLGSLTGRTESWASSGFQKHIEYRYPLLDKRLVEFALSIPLSMYEKDGYSRYLFRHAISKYIPKGIVWSETKYENERADRHNTLMFEFLENWLNKYEFNHEKYLENKYIDVHKLIRYIQDICHENLGLDDIKKIKKMMIAGKSILLLNMIND